MAKVITKSKGKTQEHEIEGSPGGFTVILHQQGMKVTVPEFVEVNMVNCQQTVSELKQHSWDFIREGELFQVLFYMSFDPDDNIEPPHSVEDLKTEDDGIINVVGMTIQGCEAMFAGRSVSFKNPENGLHPKTERYIVSMFKAMLKFCGKSGVVTAEGEDKKKTDEKSVHDGYLESMIEDATKALKIKKDKKKLTTAQQAEKEKKIVIRWLQSMEKAKGTTPIANYNDKLMTAAQLIPEVENDTEIGKQLSEAYLKSYPVGA